MGARAWRAGTKRASRCWAVGLTRRVSGIAAIQSAYSASLIGVVRCKRFVVLRDSLLVASISAGRVDGCEGVEIEVDERLECLGRGAVAEGVRHRCDPVGIFCLQGEQVGCG